MSVYVPASLAHTWEAVLRGETSPLIALGDFLDDWNRFPDLHERERMIGEPISDSASPEQHRWASFFAATVEYLTVRNGMKTPSWAMQECWVLPEPWFLLPGWKMRAWLLVATPPPWKRRRIFGGDETMLIGRV